MTMARMLDLIKPVVTWELDPGIVELPIDFSRLALGFSGVSH